MNKVLIKIFILCLLISYAVIDLQAQSNWVEWKEDISEAEDISKWQEQYESLSELAEHPSISIQSPGNNWNNCLFFPIK